MVWDLGVSVSQINSYLWLQFEFVFPHIVSNTAFCGTVCLYLFKFAFTNFYNVDSLLMTLFNWYNMHYIYKMPDCWLEVSIRNVLRSATMTQVFLRFLVSISKC